MRLYLAVIDVTIGAAILLALLCLYFLFEVGRVLLKDKKRAQEIQETN